MSTDEAKKVKTLKAGVKLKAKPAVVPKTRKIKTKGDRLPIDTFIPKGITKWNVILSLIVLAVIALTVVNTYFFEFVRIPLPSIFLQTIIPIVLFIEIIILVLVFEFKKIQVAFTFKRALPIIVIISGYIAFVIYSVINAAVIYEETYGEPPPADAVWGVLTGLLIGLAGLTAALFILGFPIFFLKYHTRHSVKRIVFTGLLLWMLVFSFFTPYFGLVGKFRDLPPGGIEDQNVDPDWFNSLFEGSAPFYIDGLLDLLDALDLNDTLGQQDMAVITAIGPSTLGNFLYRWEVYDRYSASTWEFSGSDATRYPLVAGDLGPPTHTPSVENFEVNQTVYTNSLSTALQSSMLTTWSTYDTPNIQDMIDWDSGLRDANGSVAAEPGTTNVRFNTRDQLTLESTVQTLAFVGTYDYTSYFARDIDIPGIIADNQAYSEANLNIWDSNFNDTYDDFLQIPLNYDSISPLTWAYAKQLSRYGKANSHSVYDQIAYTIDRLLIDHGLPTAAQTDNGGRDRAELLREGSDQSISAFLSLAVMVLRIGGIPVRPVFGFAIGDSTGIDERTLRLSNLYVWLEALMPLDDGIGGTNYQFGQFQIGPYPQGSNLIYCENTLYSSYNISVEMLGAPTQNIGGEDVYLIDYGSYDVRAHVSNDDGDVPGVNITFKTISVSDLQTYQSNPSMLLSIARDIGSQVTDAFGLALITPNFDDVNYVEFNPSNPQDTMYVVMAMVTLLSYDARSFAVLPTGYLSSVTMNTTKQTLPNPQNPLETYDYYIAQKGRNFQISTILYEDQAHTTPLVSRLVTYYVLTQNELSQLLLGLIGPEDLTKIGEDRTNINGNSTVHSVNQTTQVDVFAPLLDNTTYFVAAVYGQNYTYAVMLIVDALKSTIEIDASDLSNFDLDVYLYSEPYGGIKEDLANEPLEIWIAPDDDYSPYIGDPTGLQTYLLTTYNSSDPRNARIMSLPGSTTDGNGFYNATYNVDISDFGVGVFRVIVFFVDTWNTSSTFTISSGPALSVNNYVSSNLIEIGFSALNQNLGLNNFIPTYISFNEVTYRKELQIKEVP